MNHIDAANDDAYPQPYAVLVTADRFLRRNLRRQLERLGCEVREFDFLADDSDFGERRAQVVLLDGHAPARAIQQSIHIVRNDDRVNDWNTPILALCHAERYQVRERLETWGANEVVDHRLGPDELRNALMLWLGGWLDDVDVAHRAA